MNTIKDLLILTTITVTTISIGLAQEPTESPELDSKLYELHFQEGSAHNDNGDRALARKHFLMTIYLHPDHAGANYQLGLMAYSDNNYSAMLSLSWKEQAWKCPTRLNFITGLGGRTGKNAVQKGR